MTDYKRVKYLLTDSQRKSIASAYSKNEPVTLRLNKANITSSRDDNGYDLLLSNREFTKLQDGKTHEITIPKSRVVKMGGFFWLLPLLAALAGAAGGTAGVVAGVKKSKAADAEKAAAEAIKATELAKQKLLADANQAKTGSGYKKKKPSKIGCCNGTPKFLLGQ